MFFDQGYVSGRKITFPARIFPISVSKISSVLLGKNEKHFVKEVFWSEAWDGISNSVSCFKINFELFGKKETHPEKVFFLSEALKWDKKIPFSLWIIPFPVLKINCELLGKNEKQFEK